MDSCVRTASFKESGNLVSLLFWNTWKDLVGGVHVPSEHCCLILDET